MVAKWIAALAVWFVVSAAPAAATPQQDGLFLYNLGEAGLRYESATAVIIEGKRVCSELMAGIKPSDIAARVMRDNRVDKLSAARFVIIAVAIYCGPKPGDGPKRNFQNPRGIVL